MNCKNSVLRFGDAHFLSQIKGEWELAFMRASIDDLLAHDNVMRERTLALLERHERHLGALLALPEVERLTRVSQAGYKYIGTHRANAEYSRYHHSVSVAATAMAMAVAAGLPDSAALAALALGLWHDSGHFALSHDLEPLVARKLGFSHEQRSVLLSERSQALSAILVAMGAPENFYMAMAGQGSLPRLLSLADTASYVRDDVIAHKLTGGWSDHPAELVLALRGVHPWGYEATSARPFERLLEARARLYRKLYVSEINTVIRAVLSELASLCAGQDPGFWRMVARDVDSIVNVALRRYADGHGGWPRLLWRILDGVNHPVHEFAKKTFNTEAELEQFRARLIVPALVTRPSDFRPKKYRVRVGLVTQTLQATVRHLQPHHLEYRLYIPKVR